MGEGDKSLNGYNIVFSNNVPSTLAKGGSGNVLSALIFGNFNDLVIGQWGGIEVLVDPYTQARTGTTRYIINSFHDVAVLRAQSFAAIVDIVTA
jgi:HK97 family phage major capsid protein